MPRGRNIALAVLIVAVAVALASLGVSGIRRGDELDSVGEFAPRQVVWLAMCLPAFCAALLLPYRRLKEFSYLFYGAAVFLLVAVFAFPPINGARRWIPLGAFAMQPSELAKLAYILALAQYLMYRKNHRTLLGLIPPFLMTLTPVLLILKEPDLGTALLFFPVLYAVLFAAGARRRHLIGAALAGVAVLPLLWTVMSAEQKSRVTAVILQRDTGEPEPGDGYHLHQAKQLFSLGGIWGSQVSGMPLSDPAAYRLPAGRTDFVFCLVGEKWGLPGTLGVLGLFGMFAITGLWIAARTRDPFARLVVTGVVAMLCAQVLINTAMTVGLAPVTGITLPLMSYGGSSLLTTAFSLGILCNIARDPGYDVAGQPFQFATE